MSFPILECIGMSDLMLVYCVKKGTLFVLLRNVFTIQSIFIRLLYTVRKNVCQYSKLVFPKIFSLILKYVLFKEWFQLQY